MVPVAQVMPEALASILRKAPLTDEKVAFAWRTAVGPAVAKASTIALRDGLLTVRVSEPGWRDELERSAGVIRARLDKVLGPRVVRYITVTLDTGL